MSRLMSAEKPINYVRRVRPRSEHIIPIDRLPIILINNSRRVVNSDNRIIIGIKYSGNLPKPYEIIGMGCTYKDCIWFVPDGHLNAAKVRQQFFDHNIHETDWPRQRKKRKGKQGPPEPRCVWIWAKG